jgi:hypothetical protein
MMPKSKRPSRDLDAADRRIGEAAARVARQRERIEKLALAGQDTAIAEKVLAAMLASLDALRAHRAAIVRAEAAATRTTMRGLRLRLFRRRDQQDQHGFP